MAFSFTHHIFFLMGPAHPIPTLHSHLAILTAQTATPGRNLVEVRTRQISRNMSKWKEKKKNVHGEIEHSLILGPSFLLDYVGTLLFFALCSCSWAGPAGQKFVLCCYHSRCVVSKTGLCYHAPFVLNVLDHVGHT